MVFSILKLFGGGPKGPIVGEDWILSGISLKELNDRGYINLPKSRFPIHFKEEFQDAADTQQTGAYYRAALRMQIDVETMHPIFHRSRWHEVDAKNYLLLTPSLLLASRILDEPHILPFIKGFLKKPLPRLNDAVTEQKAGQPLYTFDTADLDAWQWEETWRTLNGMKENIVFQFVDIHKQDINDDTMGITSELPVLSSPIPTASKALITFSKDFLDVFQRKLKATDLAGTWKPGTDAKSAYLRTQLLFAITAVHEVIHAIWRTNSLRYANNDPAVTSVFKSPFEPYWRDQRMNELGNAWENQVFRGTFWPIGTPKSCAVPYGLYSLPFPSITRVEGDGGCIERGDPEEWGVKWATMYPVEMEFVRSLFTHDKWKEVQRYGIRRLRRTKKFGYRVRLKNPASTPVIKGVTSPAVSVGSVEGEEDASGVVRRG